MDLLILKTFIRGIIKGQSTRRAIAKKLKINADIASIEAKNRFPYIMANYRNPRIRKMLLKTNEEGHILVERLNKTYKIDRCLRDFFFSLKLTDNGNGYLYGTYNRKNFYYHRVVIGAKKGEEVDHKSGVKSDIRMCNLRICSRQENSFNKVANGVIDTGRGLKKRYKAHICGIHIAYFETFDEASNCYKQVHKIIGKSFSPHHLEDDHTDPLEK